MQLLSNFNLKAYNTFGISASSDWYFSFESEKELVEGFSENTFQPPFLILGGGSNLLFTSDYKGTVIHPQNEGFEIIKEDNNNSYVVVQAGVEWDRFVEWTCENNLWGVENLSLIPGNVGAAPVQNIGAYGCEAKDVIAEVRCFDIEKKDIVVLSNDECEFGYRDSVFKNTLKNVIVVSVTFRLCKNSAPQLSYANLKEEVEKRGAADLKTIRETIISVRESKLPDPDEFGNAGSFFKNPVVSKDEAERVLESFPKAVNYPLPDGNVKFAAGWLIDNAGLKGYKNETVGVHDKQALVLINRGGASGSDVVALAEHIQSVVNGLYGITLEPEVLYL